MSRPYDWYPLAESDPVPGDVESVRRSGQDYSAVSDAIVAARSDLETIASMDSMESDAVEALAESASKVRDEMEKVAGRYGAAGEALATYAGVLEEAQRIADEALTSARTAQGDLDDAQGRVTTYEDSDDPADASSLRWAHEAATDAGKRLGTARTNLEFAVTERDTAARAAAEKIRTVVESDGLNDGWWENWGSDVAHWVSDVAGTIATVAGVLALVLAWVPGLGAALGAIALIAGAVALVADIAIASHGEGGWDKVVWGAIGVATFGVGRVATQALKVGAKGVQAAGRCRADVLYRATQGAQGVRSGVRGVLGGQGYASQGIFAARNAFTAFKSGKGAWGVVKVALAPKNVLRDLGTDLGGLGQGARSLATHPIATWKGTFDGVSGLRNNALAWFGAGDEARGVASVGAADARIADSFTGGHLGPGAVVSAEDYRAAVNYASGAAWTSAGTSAMFAGNDTWQGVQSIPEIPDTVAGLFGGGDSNPLDLTDERPPSTLVGS